MELQTQKEILDQFPLNINDTELLQLLAKFSGETENIISDIRSFINTAEQPISKERFQEILHIIDTMKRKKMLESINVISKYTKKSKEEVIQTLNIPQELLANETMIEIKSIFVSIKEIYQKLDDLEREMARDLFDNKYYGTSNESLVPHLSAQECKEYGSHYHANSKTIDQQELDENYPPYSKKYFKQKYSKKYFEIKKNFDETIDLTKKHKSILRHLSHEIMFEVGIIYSFNEDPENMNNIFHKIASYKEQYDRIKNQNEKMLSRC